jgi:hypothetical protein
MEKGSLLFRILKLLIWTSAVMAAIAYTISAMAWVFGWHFPGTVSIYWVIVPYLFFLIIYWLLSRPKNVVRWLLSMPEKGAKN